MEKLIGPDPKNWDGIGRLASLKIVQFTILVPLFGYLILFSSWFKESFVVFGEFPTWKIYFIYYGFTVLAVASLIYNWRCPSLIKLYRSASEYVSQEERVMNKSKLYELVKNIYILVNTMKANPKGKYTSQVEDFISEIDRGCNEGQYNEMAAKKLIDPLGEKDTIIPQLMFVYFELLKETDQRFRKAVYYLYWTGFVIIAVPSIAMFLEVIANSLESVEFLADKLS